MPCWGPISPYQSDLSESVIRNKLSESGYCFTEPRFGSSKNWILHLILLPSFPFYTSTLSFLPSPSLIFAECIIASSNTMVTVKPSFPLPFHFPYHVNAWQLTIISYLHNIRSSSENAVGMLGITAICFAIPLSASTCKTATTLVPEMLSPRVLNSMQQKRLHWQSARSWKATSNCT